MPKIDFNVSRALCCVATNIAKDANREWLKHRNELWICEIFNWEIEITGPLYIGAVYVCFPVLHFNMQWADLHVHWNLPRPSFLGGGVLDHSLLVNTARRQFENI